VSESTHMSDIYEDEDGWIIPRCTCGWEWGPVPDRETATDVLMEHVFRPHPEPSREENQ